MVRGAALVSVVVGTVLHGPVASALFLLVLGGTMLPRAYGAPPALDWASTTLMLAAGWAALLDWYVTVPALDLLAHAVVTGVVAALAVLVLGRLGVLPGPDDPLWRRPRTGVAVVTACLGLALAVLWELGEWFGHAMVDERIQVGYADTMGDLAAAAAGTAVAAVLVARHDLLADRRR